MDRLFVVSNAQDATTWLPGTTVVSDTLVGAGSAAGIHAALRAAGGPVLAVAWDLPFVTTPVLQLLVRRASAGTAADAVVPAGTTDAEMEPLCAWYGPACATAIEAEWPAGDLSLHGLLRRVATIVVPLNEIQAVAPLDRVFLNVNTPDDLQRARRFAAEQPPVA